jgi:hypothetical protein
MSREINMPVYQALSPAVFQPEPASREPYALHRTLGDQNFRIAHEIHGELYR